MCSDVQGTFALTLTGRGADTVVAPGTGGPWATSDCVSCGGCVDTCPTGAITQPGPGRGLTSRRAPADRVRTICGYCGVGCALDVVVREDRVASVLPSGDGPVNRGYACVKGRFAYGYLESAERLTEPLVRENGVLSPAGWDEVIARVAEGCAPPFGAVAPTRSPRSPPPAPPTRDDPRGCREQSCTRGQPYSFAGPSLRGGRQDRETAAHAPWRGPAPRARRAALPQPRHRVDLRAVLGTSARRRSGRRRTRRPCRGARGRTTFRRSPQITARSVSRLIPRPVAVSTEEGPGDWPVSPISTGRMRFTTDTSMSSE
ncbi:4Fe-4S binding protein [Streptomyces roseofulvus]|uniref:4Fe-4S binding protein n=1 Tax=Streptomyces roseofulvus TaxID=33902 RepID=UPI0035E926A2